MASVRSVAKAIDLYVRAAAEPPLATDTLLILLSAINNVFATSTALVACPISKLQYIILAACQLEKCMHVAPVVLAVHCKDFD